MTESHDAGLCNEASATCAPGEDTRQLAPAPERPWMGTDGTCAQRHLLVALDRDGLMRRRDAPALRRIASQLVLILLTGALVRASAASPWQWPAMLVHGALLVSLFAPLHECIHSTAFRSRWLNRVVAVPAGFLLLIPPRWFHWFHLAHHRYTQEPARDPELASPKPRNLRQWLWQVSGVPYWRAQAGLLLALAAGRVEGGFVPRARRAGVVREARLFLLAYLLLAVASVLAGSTALLHYWVLPVFLAQPLLRLYLLAEHTGCPEVADMLANTRTTLTSSAIRWLAWNMPYHAEHHLAPAAPFHALPGVHTLVRDRLRVLAPGYVCFHRSLLKSFHQPH